MSEINPNNPATIRAREQWHKLLALVMHKNGLTDVEITLDDIARMGSDYTVVCDERNGELWIRVMSNEEAMKLAKTQGGFPV